MHPFSIKREHICHLTNYCNITIVFGEQFEGTRVLCQKVARDRYTLCALTDTAFSIICEFRAGSSWLPFVLCSVSPFAFLHWILVFFFLCLHLSLFFFHRASLKKCRYRFSTQYIKAYAVFHVSVVRVTCSLLFVVLCRAWLHQLHECDDRKRICTHLPIDDAYRSALDKKRPMDASQSMSRFFGFSIIRCTASFFHSEHWDM